MNALALELLGVAKEYLGPAAPAFLSRELQALGTNPNSVAPAHLVALSERARVAATKLMDSKRAGEFADALYKRGDRHAPVKAGGDHHLATVAAAKLLTSGKLRQAEAAYRELVSKHGDVDSYAGLARTLVSLDERDAALTVLREGAAAFAKKSNRVDAIALLGVAVELAPFDLAAHRRLAAALANQGDLISACQEYGRYIDVALAQRDIRRAWLELTYGRETLGDIPQLLAIADRVAAAQGGAMPTPPPPTRAAATPSTTVAHTPAAPARPAPAPAPAKPASPAAGKPPLFVAPRQAPQAAQVAHDAAVEAKHVSALAAAVQARTRPAASSAVVLRNAETITHAERTDVASASDWRVRAGLDAKMAKPQPNRVPMPPVDVETELSRHKTRGNVTEDAAVAANRAAILVGARDERCTETALDAARKLIALHKLQAASDVLLDLIAAGVRSREAQRLLIEVNCELGRRETAREKCHLLGAAYRLDGQGAIAEDVERLAQIL